MGRQIDSISSVTLDTLTRYQWPGNIRELQNVIERSVILTQGHVLNLAMSEIGAATPSISSSEIGSTTERERIRKALKDANGIVSGPNGAARLLGLKRTTLQARMKRLQITRAGE
jgi:formate hydrogenlyase transcriptional activator